MRRFFPTSQEVSTIISHQPDEPIFMDQARRLYGFNRQAEQMFYDSRQIDNVRDFALWVRRPARKRGVNEPTVGFPVAAEGPVTLFLWEDGERGSGALGQVMVLRQLAGSATRRSATNGLLVKTNGWLWPFYKQGLDERVRGGT